VIIYIWSTLIGFRTLIDAHFLSLFSRLDLQLVFSKGHFTRDAVIYALKNNIKISTVSLENTKDCRKITQMLVNIGTIRSFEFSKNVNSKELAPLSNYKQVNYSNY
jgi:hypothetical protein